ncbi:folylpolyglutamate synthase/dihydrofolate synthase family protein [Hydrogenibacillus sp. N12]|uniref:bifunctional folylpolyglutamate synthase/dihydrofolate synthase n=1 Tax=Hydrogenibacillus sp. N12 TaxID=2866627 RepID=UPI001C7E0F75|nr:folylpolyglutamate synthase/dihydrofolate synthase family protein [Hydrogenibacillus sp. N12]QZA33672.1 bifunctional folylpolyglutamate synthase/dihydrofolate synthase [Hydrogenibacillus sp. N12]
MDVRAIIAWFEAHRKDVYEPGTVRMEALLERLGHPERRLKFVHIAGTNGKGSTLAFLHGILRAAGYDVGAYISPHVTTYESRIQLNGAPIDPEGLRFVYETLRPHAEALAAGPLGAPTEFELLTAAAIVYFARRAYPDVVLWETGMGGRLDSTNVVYPILSIITRIGYDHVRLLGPTLRDIAREKAGIIKSGVPVVTAPQAQEAMAVLEETARARRTTLYGPETHYWIEARSLGPEGQRLTVATLHRRYPDLALGLVGVHQFENAAVAVVAAEVLRLFYAFYIEDDHIAEGLRKAEHPGRFERFVDAKTGVPIVLDGAHNEDGMNAFSRSLEALFPARRRYAVFAAMKDKDHRAMLMHLLPRVDGLVVTAPDVPRARDPEDVARTARMIRPEVPVYIHQAPEAALSAAIRLAAGGDKEAPGRPVKEGSGRVPPEEGPPVVAVTGSLYLIQAVRPAVLRRARTGEPPGPPSSEAAAYRAPLEGGGSDASFDASGESGGRKVKA